MVLSADRAKLAITTLDNNGFSTFEIQQLLKLRYKDHLINLPQKSQSEKLSVNICNYPPELTQRSKLYNCKRMFPCKRNLRKGMYYCISHLQFAIDNNWRIEVQEEKQEEPKNIPSLVRCCFELEEMSCQSIGEYECQWGTFCFNHTFLKTETINELKVDESTKAALHNIVFLDENNQRNSKERRFLSRKHGIGFIPFKDN